MGVAIGYSLQAWGVYGSFTRLFEHQYTDQLSKGHKGYSAICLVDVYGRFRGICCLYRKLLRKL